MKVKILKVYWCKCGNATHPHPRIRIKALHGKGNFQKYIFVVKKFCCTDMRLALANHFIWLGNEETAINQDSNVNIPLCKSYPEGTFYELMPVQFCPFCGEPIEIEE